MLQHINLDAHRLIRANTKIEHPITVRHDPVNCLIDLNVKGFACPGLASIFKQEDTQPNWLLAEWGNIKLRSISDLVPSTRTPEWNIENTVWHKLTPP